MSGSTSTISKSSAFDPRAVPGPAPAWEFHYQRHFALVNPHFSYFFPSSYTGHRGGEGFHIDCGIVINGNFSRLTTNPKHSFRLKFKGQYGSRKLRYPLFAERGASEFDTLVIGTGHNEGWATGHAYTQLLRNQFARYLHGLDPSQFTDFEFVEFFNAGAETLDLNGVAVDSAFVFRFTSSNLTLLQPGERLLVVSNIAAFTLRY
ncbi:MAG TPA: hypothetical protein VMN36_17125, partial [Verrucomicrobiales bacterium]|nr:hypothetical protein [Verrucomicrobiales bacterium]